MIQHAHNAPPSAAINWGIIQSPPPLYRPAPLWSWNETLPLDEVRRQVRELARGGLGGAFMHTRIGLTTPYLGEEYLAAVRAAVEEAARLGLHMYLYDEDRWPSGWGGGQVPLRDERFRVKWLYRAAPGEASPPGDVTLLSQDTDSTRYYRVVSPLGHPNFSGTSYADLMDRDAMQAFIEVAYAPFARAVGEYFGNVIPAMFTDEPAITYLTDLPGLPRRMLPWTDALLEQFGRDHGYDLLPHLGELFEDVGTYSATRTAYYRTCAGLFERNYTQQLAAWCHDHGLAFTGHFMGEHSLAFTLAWDVAILPHYRHEDWPGIDHLGLQVQEVITPIGCRSVVNQYAKPRMMSELYGTAGQHLTFADRKWIAEQQIVLGVNFLVPHLALFTMSGERKRDYPANLFYQQPWWPQNHIIDDYLARLCALMSQGQMVPEFLVLHPQESLYPLRRPPQPDAGDWAFFDERDRDRIDAIDHGFQTLSRQLLDWQRSFDYGDETILAEVGSVDSTGPLPLLRVGAMTYPLVVLPALTTLRTTTLDLLVAFAAAGGPIVATGQLPTMLDGRPDAEGHLRRFLATAVEISAPVDLQQRLAALALPQVRSGDMGGRPWLWQQTRRIGEQCVTMLVNLARHTAVADTIALNMTGPLTRIDLVRQTQTKLSGDNLLLAPFTLQLAPGESAIFVTGPGDAALPTTMLPTSPYTEALTLTDWQVERLDENVLTLDYAAFRCSNEPFGDSVPVLAIQQWLSETHYTGPVSLRYTFTSTFAGAADHPLALVVEYPERCAMLINGISVTSDGTIWRDIRWARVPITSHVRPGTNTIELVYDAFRPGDMASYADAAARYGSELEAVYLIGDFAVQTTTQGIRADTLPLAPALPWQLHVLTPQPHISPPQRLTLGDLVPQGLPFYAGTIAYRATFTLADVPRAASLNIREFHAPVAEVWVNGQRIGALAWEPYRLDITQALHQGENLVEIVLAHSLRNMLGPHHNPAGETMWREPAVLFVGPHSFRPTAPDWAARLSHGETPVAGWDAAYRVVPFGLPTGVVIEWTSAPKARTSTK